MYILQVNESKKFCISLHQVNHNYYLRVKIEVILPIWWSLNIFFRKSLTLHYYATLHMSVTIY